MANVGTLPVRKIARFVDGDGLSNLCLVQAVFPQGVEPAIGLLEGEFLVSYGPPVTKFTPRFPYGWNVQPDKPG